MFVLFLVRLNSSILSNCCAMIVLMCINFDTMISITDWTTMQYLQSVSVYAQDEKDRSKFHILD